VTLVVPFPPGGPTDLAARLLQTGMQAELGQTVVVDNRPGATGAIGSRHVAQSAPDGHTLLVAASGTLTINPVVMRNPGYDVEKDFAPLTMVMSTPNMLVVHPSVPARDIKELIAYAKANPGKLNYGTAGTGSSQHVSAAMFAHLAGIEMTHVPYRGGAPAVSDLLAGRVQVVFAPVVEVLEPVRGGALRAMGLTIARRLSLLPDVPAIGEQLQGYEVAGWVGLFAPAGTPPAAVERISREAGEAVRVPALRDRLAELGFEAVGSTPAEFAAFQLGEVPKWAELIRISGASPE
jgi:tripartite-type tricarboxylate transporter receptor subunit TctC